MQDNPQADQPNQTNSNSKPISNSASNTKSTDFLPTKPRIDGLGGKPISQPQPGGSATAAKPAPVAQATVPTAASSNHVLDLKNNTYDSSMLDSITADTPAADSESAKPTMPDTTPEPPKTPEPAKAMPESQEASAIPVLASKEPAVDSKSPVVPPAHPGNSAGEPKPAPQAENAAAQPAAAGEVPKKGWNWGAFFLSWIWAIGNHVWIGLLALVPVVNIFIIFYLGAKGNELAWKAKQWASPEAFIATQKKWSKWGVILFILALVLGLLGGVFVVITISSAVSTTSTGV